MERRVQQTLVHAGGFNSWRMQDRNHVAFLCALEVLIAAGAGVEEQAAGRIGEKSVGPDFRIDRLRENVAEGQPEYVRAQVINIGDGANVVLECPLGIEAD